MGRQKKSAAISVAKAGSGKSALIEHIQYLLDQGSEIVHNMRGKNLYFLDASKLTGGTSERGSLELRFSQIIAEIKDPKNSDKIIVLDELENCLKDENCKKFIEELKTYMAGDMPGAKFMFNITPGPYEELMKDPQLVRRMVPVFRDDLTDQTVLNIIATLAKDIETRYGVRITANQQDQIFRLSKMHPTLANPDVAITLIDDTVSKLIKERDSGSYAIQQLRSRIENYEQALLLLEARRREGILKVLGPYYNNKIKKYNDLIERGNGVVRAYQEGREATAHLRRQLDEKVNERAELFNQSNANSTNQEFGDTDPSLLRFDELTEEIEELSEQIMAYGGRQTMVGITPNDNHVREAAVLNLNISQRQIDDTMTGGVGTDVYVNRALRSDSRLESNKVVVKSIVERILTKRRFAMENQTLPSFLIIDPKGTQQADNVVNGITNELFEQGNSYSITGAEITDKFSMNNHIGSDGGTVGNERIGSLYKTAKDTNGFMTILATNIDRAHDGLTNFLQSLIKTGTRQSNHGDLVDFSDSSVFMTTSSQDLVLSEVQLAEFNNLATDAERQQYLRAFVKENFTGKATDFAPGHKLEDDFLRNVEVIYLDDATDISADILIANELKSSVIRNAIENNEFSLQFDESVTAHLADRMRQLGGGTDVKQVVEEELLTMINRAFNEGEVIPGDEALLGHDGSQYIFIKREWDDPSVRERHLAEHRIQMGSARLIEGPSGSSSDVGDTVESLLDEMSEIH